LRLSTPPDARQHLGLLGRDIARGKFGDILPTGVARETRTAISAIGTITSGDVIGRAAHFGRCR
jgi:hypothetical protein